MKKIKTALVIFSLVFFLPFPLTADDFDYSRMEMSYKNFMKCELTRTDATNHFGGKPFKITMIDLFNIQYESDMKIVTGAIECFVDNKYQTLYSAVGLITVLDTEQVAYYTIRKNDFSILATELLKFPYKERCKWTQYWIDLD